MTYTSEISPQPGTAGAVLQGVAKLSGSWAESAAEMDEALEYLRNTQNGSNCS